MIVEKQAIIDALQDSNVICWSDLLVKLGLLPVFRKYKKEHNEMYSIQKVYMGKTLMNWVDEILKARIVRSKDRRVRGLKEKYRLSVYGMDCLQSMPVEADDTLDYMELKGV